MTRKWHDSHYGVKDDMFACARPLHCSEPALNQSTLLSSACFTRPRCRENRTSLEVCGRRLASYCLRASCALLQCFMQSPRHPALAHSMLVSTVNAKHTGRTSRETQFKRGLQP